MKVQWIDGEREPKCAPDENYPDGIDLPALLPTEPSCRTELPYPAKRCGIYLVECEKCRISVACTTAGRADDPRSITINCKRRPQ
jgi:hypothetical protein